jgi:lipoteichoic acid synthase
VYGYQKADSPHMRRTRRVTGQWALLALTVLSLWAKQLYAGYAVQKIWPTEELIRWALDHVSMFAATLGGALVVTAWTAALPRRPRLVALIAINALATTIILADYIYIYWSGDVVSVLDAISNREMARVVGTSVITRLEPVYLWYYVDVVAVPLIVAIYRRRAGEPQWGARALRLAIGATCVGVVLTAPAFASVTARQDADFAFDALQRDIWTVLGAVPYHVADVVVRTRGRTSGPNDGRRIASFFANRPAAQVSPLHGVAAGANLILLSAESLQGFPLGLKVDGVDVAPRLTAFAAESLQFTNFFDQTHLGTTSDGEFVSLNSLHPPPVGYAVYRFQSNAFRALPALLRDRGYTTVSAVGAPGDFWNMQAMHAKYGIGTSFFESSYRVDEQIGGFLADRSFFRQTVPKLAALKRPFFAFLLSSSNHHPFRRPSYLPPLNVGRLEGTDVGDYLQSVHEFDAAFGVFIDGLRDAGLLATTVVALYGDHQGFLRDETTLGPLLGFSADDKLRAFLVRKRVPFLIHLPNGAHAATQSTPTGHLDVAPTLASILGVPAAPLMLGRDASGGGDATVVFRDGSFVDGRFAFLNGIGTTSARCYELASGGRVDCAALAPARDRVRQQLDVSEEILATNALAHASKQQ